jgi:hypothetical protein
MPTLTGHNMCGDGANHVYPAAAISTNTAQMMPLDGVGEPPQRAAQIVIAIGHYLVYAVKN